MKIIHTIGSVALKEGGPAYSVPRLCRELKKQNLDVKLFSLMDAEKKHFNDESIVSFFSKNMIFGKLDFSIGMLQEIRRCIITGQVDLLHANNLWHMPAIIPGWLGSIYNVPYVISPRGTLTKYSMSSGSKVKKIYWPMIQKRILQKAVAFHATAYSEVEDLRRLGFKQPVAVIPNGIDVPDIKENGKEKESRTVLYLGRLHPEKGVLFLINAWEKISSKNNAWKLKIVGPSINGYREYLENYCLSRKIEKIEFESEVYEEDKFELFADSDLYVLPSYTENFGITVAESLACGTPVIANKGAPWQGLNEKRCGWWIDHGEDSLCHALRLAMNLSNNDRVKMGERGRKWMVSDFSWEFIGKSMSDFYGWILTKENKPEFVFE